MAQQPTIGEYREELEKLPLHKLKKLIRRQNRGGWCTVETEWCDMRKRKDVIQAIINHSIGIGGKL